MIFLLGVVVALAAAARSTWSPCGLSMLSQITPVAEAGRGHKFARTAGWFVVGSTIGGVMLGGVIALASSLVRAAAIGAATTMFAIASCALASAAIDAGMFPFRPPFNPRQVNEAWLSKYRSWVYAVGFGWQIGAGFTTYVMTAAVGLLVIVGALSANPWAAIAIGTVFGLARGLAVLLGARLRSPAALQAFHRRFDSWTEPVRRAVIGVQLAVAVIAAWIVAPVLAIAVAIGAAFTLRSALPVPRARKARPDPARFLP